MLNASLIAVISSEGWAVAGLAVTGFFSFITAVGVVVGPIIANRRASEVKVALAVAKQDLQKDANERKEIAVETKTLVNGDRAAKEAHNLALQAQLRAHGIEPVIAKAVPKE